MSKEKQNPLASSPVPGKDGDVLTPGGYRPAEKVFAANAATGVSEEHVLTPGGYRPKSQVHLIEEGHALDGTNSYHKIINKKGLVVREIGPIAKKTGNKPLQPGNIFVPADKVLPGFGSGWIAYAGWTNDTGTPISTFGTTWIVPPAPATQSNQTIFLFNGIQNSTMIYQPVLQWGYSAAGGGNYWSIASWYVDGASGPAYHSKLIQVNPGDELTGIMVLTGESGSGFSYNCYFDGIPGSGYPINNVEELTWCIETLEAYDITQCSDYPDTAMTAFTNINIETGNSNPDLNWTPNALVTDCGQSCVIVSNSSTDGEVDINY